MGANLNKSFETSKLFLIFFHQQDVFFHFSFISWGLCLHNLNDLYQIDQSYSVNAINVGLL